VIRRPISRQYATVLSLLAIGLLVVGYTWLSHRQHQRNPDDTTIPSWKQLAGGVQQAVEVNKRSGERWLVQDLKASGFRLACGLVSGIAAAVALGMFMGCYSPAEAFFHPPLALLAQIPPTAALAVFFVLAGTGDPMFVSMIGFGILPALAMSVFLAVKEFPEELQFKAYTLGASHFEVIWSILFQYVLPKLLDAIRLCIGPAMVYLIAAEMVVGDVGFGYRIRLQSKLLNMSVVYPYLALLAGFGFFADWGLRWLRRTWCPWFEGYRG